MWQTDGQTDRLLHKPCSAYYVGSVDNRQRWENRQLPVFVTETCLRQCTSNGRAAETNWSRDKTQSRSFIATALPTGNHSVLCRVFSRKMPTYGVLTDEADDTLFSRVMNNRDMLYSLSCQTVIPSLTVWENDRIIRHYWTKAHILITMTF